MRAVYIHCPETGLAVSTETVSAEQELGQSLRGTIQICPACQERHHWTAEEAWLAVDRIASPAASDVRRPD